MALGSTQPNRNEYQEYFLGVKAAGSYGWQPCHLHVLIVLKSGNLNFLEPSGPVKACNGIAFYLFSECCGTVRLKMSKSDGHITMVEFQNFMKYVDSDLNGSDITQWRSSVIFAFENVE
jgi:hypothetical protein